MRKCNACGCSINVIGYNLLNKEKPALCVACANEKIEVYEIKLGDTGFFETSQTGFEAAIGSIVSAMDIDDEPYIVRKKLLTRREVLEAQEFEGF